MENQEKESEQSRTLEMRVAALEDKLSNMNITEEEMRAYEKVASMMASQQQTTGDFSGTGFNTAASPSFVCQISRSIIPRSIIPRQIIRFCYECNGCGPCACGSGGGFFGGGGFGNFGS